MHHRSSSLNAIEQLRTPQGKIRRGHCSERIRKGTAGFWRDAQADRSTYLMHSAPLRFIARVHSCLVRAVLCHFFLLSDIAILV
jgi:hypothetical protein